MTFLYGFIAGFLTPIVITVVGAWAAAKLDDRNRRKRGWC